MSRDLAEIIKSTMSAPDVSAGWKAWAADNGATKPGSVDAVRQVLTEAGFTGSLQDQWDKYLTDAGYTGDLSQMMRDFWLDGGSAGASADENFANVVSLLHFDGDDTSTTFTDIAGAAWTPAGDAQLDTSQFKFGTASAYFDGTTDDISTPSSPNLLFEDEDFTVECFVRPAALPAVQGAIVHKRSSGGYTPWGILQKADGSFYALASMNGSTWAFISADSAPVAINDEWHHLALVRDGATMRFYLDGVEVDSGSVGTGNVMSTADVVRVGRWWTSGATYEYNGWIDELRITKGVCRYPDGTTFDPPTQQFAETAEVTTDPNFANVSLLLKMEGDDASTTFTDSSLNGFTLTTVGNAQIDDAQARFGSTSGLFDGNGDYLITPSDAAFSFEDGEYTCEGWFRPTGANTNAFMLDFRVEAGESFMLWCSQAGGAGKMYYSNQAGSDPRGIASTAFTLNAWNHWAIVRDGTTVRIYLNGAQVFSITDSRTFASPQGVYIGSSTSANQGAIGHIDEIRITKGVCRYPGGTTFIPPNEPFPSA